MDIELMKYFFNQNWIVFVSLGVAILMTFMTFSRANTLSVLPEQAIRYINDGAAIVDVRESADFNKEHIRDALNLPLSKIQKKQKTDIPHFKADETVLICCRNGMQSNTAIKQLKKETQQVKFVSMQGGISEWKKCHYPLYSQTSEKQAQKQTQKQRAKQKKA